MTERTKYDGKLTDSLIQAVIEAEQRLWIADHPAEPAVAPRATSRDCEPLAKPTPTEQAEAWRRSHCDEEPEDE